MAKGTKTSNLQKDQKASLLTENKNDISNPSSVKVDNAESKLWNYNTLGWLLVVSLVSITTRFYSIGWPNEVVADEVNIGRFASDYIKREYFIDVHPPLGKLLFAAVGYLCGYDGTFSFEEIGLSYIDSTFYINMRAFSALCGSLIVIFVYAMLIEMKFSLPITILGTTLIAFDNALITVSKFILLDSQLICYTVMTSFCWVKFRSFTKQPFSLPWWIWLFATGTCIGFTVGVKVIGLFIAVAIGVCTCLDLWDVMDPKKTKSDLTVAFHWTARIICLIALPIMIFLGSYWVHLKIANHSGTGDRYMSNAFQATLKGNNISESINPVHYGDIIKLQNEGDKVFLHSHYHKYPVIYDYTNYKFSSGGQQVAGSHEPNENNDWMILPAITDPTLDYQKISVKRGDSIRLRHISTGKYLVTLAIASPLTTNYLEVTAVDDDGKGLISQNYRDSVWLINIANGNKLRTKHSLFQLIHNITGNRLGLNLTGRLPEWGFQMQEINSGRYDSVNSWWLVEDISRPVANKTWDNDFEDFFTFWDKFSELLGGKVKMNSSNTNPPTTQLSAPGKWPMPANGTNLWISRDNNTRIDLFGNPLAWSLSLLALPLLIVLVLVDQGAYLREVNFLTSEQKKVLYPKGLFFLICYLLHYLPFFFMKTTHSFQNYLPAYLFNALIFATFYQIMAIRFKVLSKPAVVAAICSIIAGSSIISLH